MYKYEFTMSNGLFFEFESKTHLMMAKYFTITEEDESATFIFFPDTEHTFNLTQTKRLKVNGTEYRITPSSKITRH